MVIEYEHLRKTIYMKRKGPKKHPWERVKLDKTVNSAKTLQHHMPQPFTSRKGFPNQHAGSGLNVVP